MTYLIGISDYWSPLWKLRDQHNKSINDRVIYLPQSLIMLLLSNRQSVVGLPIYQFHAFLSLADETTTWLDTGGDRFNQINRKIWSI